MRYETSRYSRQALGVLAVGLVIFVGQLLGWVAGWWELETDPGTVMLTLLSFYFLVLGALIIWKAQSNRVGWVFGGVGVSIQAAALTGVLASGGVTVFDAIGGGFWISWFVAIGLLILWFPTGRVPSPGWRWLHWWGLAVIVAAFLLHALTDSLCVVYEDDLGCVEFGSNPIGLPGVPNPEYGWISVPLSVAGFAFLFLSLVSMSARHRVAHGVERQQIKWFVLACSAFAVTFAFNLIAETLGMLEPPVWSQVVSMVVIACIPLSATVAILRYRLYDIDRIVSRTVSYALVVARLGVAVAIVAAVVGTRFDEPLIVAATTLGVAAVFNPLRSRVQKVVDRRFNRSRYDAAKVIDGFAGSLRDQVDPDSVVDGWVEVVVDTMRPVVVGVWVPSPRPGNPETASPLRLRNGRT